MNTWLTTTVPGILTVSVIGAMLAAFVLHLLKQFYGWLIRVLPPAVKRMFRRIEKRIFRRLQRSAIKQLKRMEAAKARDRLMHYYLILLMRFTVAIVLSVNSMMFIAEQRGAMDNGQLPSTSALVFYFFMGTVMVYSTWKTLQFFSWVVISSRITDEKIAELLKRDAAKQAQQSVNPQPTK